MTVEECPTLCRLFEEYEKVIVYSGGRPSAFQLAKLFSKLEWAHGGLVLFGVEPTGEVHGIDAAEVDNLHRRLEPLCRELTEYLIELGTIDFCGRSVVFLIFNATPRNLSPMDQYRSRMTNHMTV
ncbi:MAG: hypothetical protein CMO55_21055 [Verrucomicrobiales bacterium]|nr:hypothetical protein [Verrucomicrobiales bacterium]